MKALNIKFGIAFAAAAMLSVAAFANDGAVGFNKGHNNVKIEIRLGGGAPNHINMAEMKADEMRRELRLSARTYREVLNFYRDELRFGGHINPMKEEAAMRRILTGREYRMWKDMSHKGHKAGPGMGPKGPAHGRF